MQIVKSLKLVVFSLILTLSVGQNLHAATGTDGQGTIRCADALTKVKGVQSFMREGIFDSSYESFVMFWQDIIITYNVNYCKFTELDSLVRRKEQMRRSLRRSFYSCDYNSVERLSNDYHKLTAEIWFLRNFPTFSPGKSDQELDSLKNEYLFGLRSNLKTEFIQTFANRYKYFDTVTAERFFNEFEEKYFIKLDAYNNCNLGLLNGVGELAMNIKTKFEQFQTSLEAATKRFEQRINNRVEASETRIRESSGFISSAFNSSSVEEYFGNFIMLNGVPVNELAEDDMGLSEDIREAASLGEAPESSANVSPFSAPPAAVEPTNPESSETSSFREISNQFQEFQTVQDYQSLEARYIGFYDVKYRVVNDSGLKRALVQLKELEEIIKTSLPEISDLNECTTRIAYKQCANKQ